MNQKQVKLLRYFIRHTKDIQLAASVKAGWPHMTEAQKKKVTVWMRKVVATLAAIKDEKAKRQKAANLEVLKGFV